MGLILCKHSSKCFKYIYIDILNLLNSSLMKAHTPVLQKGKQRGKANCPRTHSWVVLRLGSLTSLKCSALGTCWFKPSCLFSSWRYIHLWLVFTSHRVPRPSRRLLGCHPCRPLPTWQEEAIFVLKERELDILLYTWTNSQFHKTSGKEKVKGAVVP